MGSSRPIATASTPYTGDYFDAIAASSEASAAVVVPRLCELFQPRSVVDVGCGTGLWLACFQRQQGVREVLGIDGPWVDLSALAIPPSAFEEVDLTRPPKPTRRFDLVTSLEVAEHLPEDSANAFVDFLTELGPAVAFSAAIPEQGGNAHLNERWPAYWSGRFEARGYVPIDAVRPAIWLDERVAWWFRQNLILYVHREHLDRYEHLGQASANVSVPLPLVHPELYLYRLQQARESGADPSSPASSTLSLARLRERVRLRTRLREKLSAKRVR